MSVDHKHGFIRSVTTGTASEHDGHHFDDVLDLQNTGRVVNAEVSPPEIRCSEK